MVEIIFFYYFFLNLLCDILSQASLPYQAGPDWSLVSTTAATTAAAVATCSSVDISDNGRFLALATRALVATSEPTDTEIYQKTAEVLGQVAGNYHCICK